MAALPITNLGIKPEDDHEEKDRQAREDKLKRSKNKKADKPDPKAKKTLLELAIAHGPPGIGCRVTDIVSRTIVGSENHYEVEWNDDDYDANDRDVEFRRTGPV